MNVLFKNLNTSCSDSQSDHPATRYVASLKGYCAQTHTWPLGQRGWFADQRARDRMIEPVSHLHGVAAHRGKRDNDEEDGENRERAEVLLRLQHIKHESLPREPLHTFFMLRRNKSPASILAALAAITAADNKRRISPSSPPSIPRTSNFTSSALAMLAVWHTCHRG